MPGGVSSPVRAYRAVGGTPPFVASAHGPRIRDADGREYLDLQMSFGPLILGHAHPEVVEAVTRRAALGTSYGAPTEVELELAETVCRLVPGVEMVRLVNSGTEAVMSALRLARAATGRSRILKFAGGYHGHYDPLLASGGSGLATLGLEASAGGTVVVTYNDLEGAVRALERRDLAAVIVEPIAGNMGVVLPADGFLAGLREACTSSGTLLVLDEVITGFRVGLGGAQAAFGIVPDLTILGKVIGGGLPIGAYGGQGDLMRMIAPEGPVYQAGTLSGNPLACAAGLATLRVLERDLPHAALEGETARLAAAFEGLPVTVNRSASMFTVFMAAGPVSDFDSARLADTAAFAALHRHALDAGLYLPPSQFEALFLSTAHSAADISFAADVLRTGVARILAQR